MGEPDQLEHLFNIGRSKDGRFFAYRNTAPWFAFAGETAGECAETAIRALAFAQGTEARSDKTACGLGPKGDGPVAESDAPNDQSND